MKGFGHISWGAGAYNIAIAVLTMVLLPIQHYELMGLAIALTVLALIIQHFEAIANKKYKETSAKTNPIKKRFYYKSYNAMRSIIMTLLVVALVGLVIFHIGLAYNDLEFFHPGLLFLGFMLAIFGGIYPDTDSGIFGIKAHRDPTTHSAIVPSIFAIIMLFLIDIPLLPFSLVIMGFTIGAMMHLICDMIPEGSNGIQAIVSLFKWSESPGDIRGMKESREQLYLVSNGVILGIFSVMLTIRSLTERLQFPPIWDSLGNMVMTATTTGWLILTAILFIIPILLQIAFKGRKKN